ncbi:MAG TPA: hypothetical protein VNL96_09245 [Gemmatimonadaceae bacterium]|nr:hypothetical protein [Gemmatimonadaceae bacterium]
MGITIDVGSGEFVPGLINAHDHLYRNHYPRLGSPPYANAYQWGEDIHARYGEEIQRARAFPRGQAMLFSALKNLLGAVTTVVHHDRWECTLARRSFPLRVVRLRVAHSLRRERDFDAAVAGDEVTAAQPLSIHLAEGVDDESSAEVHEADRRGLLGHNLLAVHLVGVDQHGISRLEDTNTAVVWCPTSNRFLFGRTAPEALLRSEVDVLIGTDALVSADGTMLAELREARRLGYLNDGRLRESVGATAARRLRIPLPTLAPGGRADVVFLRRPPFEANPADVALVLVAGKPRLADEDLQELFTLCGIPFELLRLRFTKAVAAPLATVAMQVFDQFPECQRILDS